MVSHGDNERFACLLGEAVVGLWARLPHDVQQELFEQAVLVGHVDERDEMLREQLARFLHDHNERTA
jgi:hypothetical protein